MDIKGFQFSAVEAAIKKPGRKDLALIFSEVPATACCRIYHQCRQGRAGAALRANISKAEPLRR